jgi:hypothetical protein
MHRPFRSAAVLAALALLAALPAFAGEPRSVSSQPPTLLSVYHDSACQSWIETSYYTSSAHTTLVGHCTITCQQWQLENVIPTFEGGGTCTGTSSSFGVDQLHLCPCPP